VINNLTAAVTRRYVCRGCNIGCERGVTHRCQETCSDCMPVPPCPYADVRIPCETRNRRFRIRACFDKQDEQVGWKICRRETVPSVIDT